MARAASGAETLSEVEEKALKELQSLLKLNFSYIEPLSQGPAEILPHLLLGSRDDAVDVQTLQRLGVTHVLNCAAATVRTGADFYAPAGMKYTEFVAQDEQGYNIMQHYDLLAGLANEAAASKGRLFVHCEAGVNRSGSLCLAYHAATSGLSLLQSARHCKVLEDAVLRLRSRVYIADNLVHKASMAMCDSALDGPHCRPGQQADLVAESGDVPAGRSALVTDGIFSTRLLATADGGEMLDEYFLGASLKAASKLRHSKAEPLEEQGPKQAPAGKRGGRSALLTFRGLKPWQDRLPENFAGTRRLGGGVPFQVEWEGPWSLVENDEFENDAVKRHRFAARLVGAVGRIRFRRPVSIQSVDLRRPKSCRVPFGMPLVVKGRRRGVEVFQEVVPKWDLHTFVNGVAFFALTSTDVVDELVFQECILIGAIQLTFGFDLNTVFSDQLPDPQNEIPMFLTLREGWHAYGWDEIEFRIPSDVDTAPVWHLNDVASQRLSLRPGVFELPARTSREAALPGLMDPISSEEEEGLGLRV
ncbi:DUSP3 [Symbiodinium natans]|uniref:protein-serine/threonine phosphatase n=1 Tax=Symbiodinium natans TaxID=878477 RepID=A0A812PTY8_9DINO|nr:DUSP3 [Symbiodinium natans]